MSDDVIWACIGHDFCSFRIKIKDNDFCRNEYNNTGLCNKTSCPLANSKYATVKEQEGDLFLCIKTAERAHMPAQLWSQIKMSVNTAEACKQIEESLIYWPHSTIQKCKMRLERLREYLLNMQKQNDQQDQVSLIPVKQKQKRREATRERKALIAAKLEHSIEKELLNRLKSGAYGSNPMNVSEEIWQKVLKENNEISMDVDEEDEEESEKLYVEYDQDSTDSEYEKNVDIQNELDF